MAYPKAYWNADNVLSQNLSKGLETFVESNCIENFVDVFE